MFQFLKHHLYIESHVFIYIDGKFWLKCKKTKNTQRTSPYQDNKLYESNIDEK